MSHSDSLPAAKAACHDIPSCQAWLATAALGEARQGCDAFLALLDELEAAPPPRQTHLDMLELLLPRLLAVLSEQTRRMAGRPLPLAPAEARAFDQVTALWLALLRAYRRLLRDAVDAQPPEPPSSLARLAARTTACASELVAAHLLARREPTPDHWHWLHASFAFAETRGISDIVVEGMHSCAAAYVQTMLFVLAQPHALSQRDMFWTRTWARRFAGRVRICRTTLLQQAYAVDLGGGGAAQWRPVAELSGMAGTQDSPWRFLDSEDLGRVLRKRLRALESGEDPVTLGLGNGHSQSGASALLRQLLQAWCMAPPAPHFPRHQVPVAQATVRVAVGLAAAHAVVGGKPFRAELRNWDYNRRDADSIHTFQQAFAAGDQPGVAALAAEDWLAADQSAYGYRLHRGLSGARVAHRQLLALRTAGLPQFLLGEARWMLQEGNAVLSMGCMLLPGLPRACAVRAHSDDPAKPQEYVQAFLLSKSRAAPGSLLLPAGWYQCGRKLDLRLDEAVAVVELASLAGRGFDYERAFLQASAQT